MRVKGELLSLSRAPDDPAAEACFRMALEEARRQGTLSWELRIALSVARLRVSQDRGDAARALLASVYERFTEGFATADLRAAQAMLDSLSSERP
jgi:predicted ATPase